MPVQYARKRSPLPDTLPRLTSAEPSAQIYRDDDTPYYYRGIRVLIWIAVWNSVLYFLTHGYYEYRNCQRDNVWNAMSPKEQADYVRDFAVFISGVLFSISFHSAVDYKG
jgi:hypothetical protein